MERKLRKPLVILEPLRCDYPWANDRFHRFILDGMAERADALARSRILYYPHVEPSRGAARGLLETLSRDASVIVTDDFPCFFLPGWFRRLPPPRLRCAWKPSIRTVCFLRYKPGRRIPRLFCFGVSCKIICRLTFLNSPGAVRSPAPLSVPRLKSLPKEITRRWPPESAAMLRAPPCSPVCRLITA